MAYVFYLAINQINNDNRLVEAETADTSGVTGCDKVLGNGIYAGGETQFGSGQDDGIYYHSPVGKGVIFTRNSPWDRDESRFARLFNQDYDDLLAWLEDYPNPGQNSYAVWKNSADGLGQFVSIDTMFVEMYCNPRVRTSFCCPHYLLFTSNQHGKFKRHVEGH